MAQGELLVQLLGEPGFVFGSKRTAMPHDKRAYLLIYLACTGEWVGREPVARLLWPEHEASAARHNLRQLLKRLRYLPWAEGLEMSGEGRDRRLRWAPPTDIARLRHSLEDRDWGGAAALYRGAPLEGVRTDDLQEFSAWLELERGRLQNLLRESLLGHAAGLMQQREPTEALKLLGPLLRAEPYDEEVLCAYMVCASASGNRGAAVLEYRRFAARLRDEFSLSPTATTEQLLERITSGDQVTDDVAPAHVYDPVLKPGSERARPTETAPRPPALAPFDSLPLIGRELELEDLVRLLSDPDCRLLTVTGTGGVGKSRLVRHAVAELSRLFGDGCVFTRAEALTSADALMAAVAQAMTLARGSGARPLDSVAGAIGERRVLLIFDDLDGVDDATGAVGELLDRCASLAILTTARERLNLTEERLLPIEGLAFPSVGAALQEALTYDAVRLFIERAQRVRPDYYLSETEVDPLVRICALVGGLPLGLELASAWTRLLSCAQIHEELSADLEFLSRSPVDAHERHKSMRASFEHSWGRLGAQERRVLAALTVFRGGFGRLSARLVASAPLAVLAALVDKSLVRADAAGTFGLHPLLQRFASEKLALEDAARARDAHARFFLSELDGPGDAVDTERLERMASLGRAFEDVMAAWSWAAGWAAGPVSASVSASASASAVGLAAASQPVQAPTAGAPRWPAAELARLSRPLIVLCDAHGRSSEGAALVGGAAEAVSRASNADADALGTLLVQQAWLQCKVGQFGGARVNARRGLELLGSRAATGWARRVGLNALGYVALREGNYPEAEARFTEALRLATRHKVSSEIASFTGNLGVVRQVMGDRLGAAEQFRRELVIMRELDHTSGILSSLSNLGNVLRLLGDKNEARTHLEEGLELALSTGNRAVLPNLRINLGVLANGLGQHTVATEHFQAALRCANEDGRRGLQANALFQLGRVSLDVGEPLAAEGWFLKALDITGSTGSLSGVIDNLTGLAWVRMLVEDYVNAEDWARAAAEHPASSAGTRSWASELLAELEQRRTAGGLEAAVRGRAGTVNEAVEGAMRALVAAR